MSKFKKSKLFLMVFLLVIGTLALWNFGSSLAIVKQTSNVVSLLDRVVALPFGWVKNVEESIDNLSHVYQENEELKSSLSLIQENTDELDSLKAENAQLRQLLDMNSSFGNQFHISAEVIARTPMSWSNVLTVNVGAGNKVTDSMLAVANGGLVGSVSQVTNHSTVVTLLSNKENTSNISVKISSDADETYGIITGYDEEHSAIVISKLNNTSEIKPESRVVTSGLGTFNAMNIEVGSVLFVKEGADSLTREVYVKPKADLSSIRVLTLVGS